MSVPVLTVAFVLKITVHTGEDESHAGCKKRHRTIGFGSQRIDDCPVDIVYHVKGHGKVNGVRVFHDEVADPDQVGKLHDEPRNASRKLEARRSTTAKSHEAQEL